LPVAFEFVPVLSQAVPIAAELFVDS